MILTIHRGSKQIGGSCVELQAANGARILLDVGMPLTQPDGSEWPRGTMTRPSQQLRAEGVLPDIEGLYAGSNPQFLALALSHAHMDHHGLAHHVHPDIPILASPGTIEMLKASHLFVPDASMPSNTREMPTSSAVQVGPFQIRGIPVDHAAPDSRALLIEADGQRLLYSGDLRAHGRQSHLFHSLPDSAGPVDVLILEGTTVGQTLGSHGLETEQDVENRLSELLPQRNALFVVIASGQNIDRAISVYRASMTSKRELVIDPYQAYILMRLKEISPGAPQFDWPGVRVKFIQSHVATLKAAGLWKLACQMSRAAKVTAEQMAQNPTQFVYLARSSGATVALMRYLAKTICPVIVWSQWSGYLKKGGPITRFCTDHAMEPIQIHSGGHAHPKDLASLVTRLHPKAVVPIHTQAAHKFAELMPNVCLVEDRTPTELSSLMA